MDVATNVTDNEIIKALECCINQEDCTGCLFRSKCDKDESLFNYALDIINRQQAEIEALQMDNKQLETDNFNANMNCEHLQAEIERMKAEQLNCIEEVVKNRKIYEQFRNIDKTEAIKEFAESFENEVQKIEEIYFDEEHENFISANKVIALLVNLVKEMVGEQK